MIRDGIHVVNFSAGESDFDTADNIKQKAIDAINSGFTKYTPVSGTLKLRQAIGEKLKQDENLDYTPDEIIVSCGAKQSIFNAILSICNESDEVIIPSPYWLSYPEMVNVAGAVVISPKTSNFKLTPKQLSESITKKTKLLILNSPCNPTGAVYTKQELQDIAKIIVKNKIYCISDEIYENMIYDGIEHTSIASLNPQIKERTIIVNGVSKTHSMTGWRIGYASGPKEVISAMTRLQSHSTSNASSIAQMAALEAISNSKNSSNSNVEHLLDRRNQMINGLNSLENVSFSKPEGAFYLWLNISKLIGKNYKGTHVDGSMTFSDLLLSEAKVAVVPGIVFGDDNYVRLSYTTSLDKISEGTKRICEFVRSMK